MMKRYIGLACFAAVCICAGCEDLSVDCVLDETKCENGNEVKCVDGRWKVTDQACTPGDSQPATPCEAGQVQCDGNILKTCVDGSWNAGTPCGEGQTCADNACKPAETAGCEPDTSKCEDNILKKCVDGSWNEGTPCGDGQTCVDNECKPAETGECEEGSSDCEDNQVKLCINGHYHSVLNCSESGQTCIKDESGRASCGCNKGETKCEGNSQMTCGDNGVWEKTECDDTKICGLTGEKQYGCRECIEGEIKCKDDNTLLSCTKAGEWKETTCQDSQICKFNESNIPSCQPRCNDKESTCEGNKLLTCRSGAWEEEECSTEESCYIIENNSSKKAVCKQCENDQTRCIDDDKKTQKCVDYRWSEEEITTCDDKSHCEENNNNAQCIQCKDGETKCEGNTLHKCNSQKWDDGEACTHGCGQPKCDDPSNCDENRPHACFECNEGETKCDGDILATCVDGFYKSSDGNYLNKQNCTESSQVCALSDIGNQVHECRESCNGTETKCEDKKDEHGNLISSYLKTCKEIDGKNVFVAESCTDKDMLCQQNSAGETPAHRCECEADSTRCYKNGDKPVELQKCEDNNWKKVEDPTQSVPPEDSVCGIDPETGKYAWVKECQHDVCADESSIYRCDPNTKVYNKEICSETTPFCNKTTITEGEVLGACNLCLNGTTKCNGNKLQTCEDGKWNEGIACPSSTPYCGKIDDGKSYQCVECVSELEQCIWGVVLTCQNGNFSHTDCFNTNGKDVACGGKDEHPKCLSSLKEANIGDSCKPGIRECIDNVHRLECIDDKVTHVDCQKGEYGEYKICSTNKDNFCYVTIANASFPNGAYVRGTPKNSDSAICNLSSGKDYLLAYYGTTAKDGVDTFCEVIVINENTECTKGTRGWIKLSRFSNKTTLTDILE
ncbi:MAG: hypothetical protein IJM59_13820 [Proteobacteria bacterium]|nr:hypothetical protein [Pseudomonadota bacterium]